MANKIFSAIFLITLIAGCGPNGDMAESLPTDLDGKRALLKEKRKALIDLENDIKKLEEEIISLSPANEQPARFVTTTRIENKDFKHYVEIQGTVQSDDMVNVTTEVPGIIMQLNVKEGDNIEKGQLIAKINLEQIDKQKAEVEKSLELARDVYDRQKRLWDQKIGSEIQYLQAKNNMERLEKSLETIAFQKSKGNIYAPISGVVEVLIAKAGEMASPGFPILTLLNTNKVKVVAEVPENYLMAVKKGSLVKVRFPALNVEKEARISLVGKTINPANRTFSVEVDLLNTGGLLKPNLLALMEINDFTLEDAVVVPIEMIQQEADGQSYVFIRHDEAGEAFARKVMVKTGKSYENEIVVEEGLKGGEEIIVKGARFVSDKEVIKVQTEG